MAVNVESGETSKIELDGTVNKFEITEKLAFPFRKVIFYFLIVKIIIKFVV